MHNNAIANYERSLPQVLHILLFRIILNIILNIISVTVLIKKYIFMLTY